MAVYRDATRRASAKLVIEDFQRQGTVIARCGERLHELEERQIALTWKVAEMPAPGEIVHLQHWSVGHLHQEDAVARDRPDGTQVSLAGEDVEGVEHQPNGGVVRSAHRLPGIPVVTDVAPPRKSFESNPETSFGGSLTELMQVGGGPLYAAEAVRSHIAADHQEVAPQLLHDIELPLGAREHAVAQAIGHPLKIAERL